MKHIVLLSILLISYLVENVKGGAPAIRGKHPRPLPQSSKSITSQHRQLFKASSLAPRYYKPLKNADRVLHGPCIPSDFVPLAILGQGSFGIVFRALHKKTGKEFAVKYLTSELLVKNRNEVQTEEFINMRLSHPHIVKYYCSMTASNGGLLQVMELCNGQQLDKAARTTKYSPTRLAFIFLQILDALRYIHSLGIIHRDIKPQNIIISKDDQVKVIDFGVSGQVNRLRGLKSLSGTIFYFPPEMLLGEPYGPAVDLYAVAGTLASTGTGGSINPYSKHVPNLQERGRLLRKGAKLLRPTGNPIIDDFVGWLSHPHPYHRLTTIYQFNERGTVFDPAAASPPLGKVKLLRWNPRLFNHPFFRTEKTSPAGRKLAAKLKRLAPKPK